MKQDPRIVPPEEFAADPKSAMILDSLGTMSEDMSTDQNERTIMKRKMNADEGLCAEVINLAGWIWAFVGPILFGVLMVATERLSHRGWNGVEQFELFYGVLLLAFVMLLFGLMFAARRRGRLAAYCRSHVPCRGGVWVFPAWLVVHGLIIGTHPVQWELFKAVIGRLYSM